MDVSNTLNVSCLVSSRVTHNTTRVIHVISHCMEHGRGDWLCLLGVVGAAPAAAAASAIGTS